MQPKYAQLLLVNTIQTTDLKIKMLLMPKSCIFPTAQLLFLYKKYAWLISKLAVQNGDKKLLFSSWGQDLMTRKVINKIEKNN